MAGVANASGLNAMADVAATAKRWRLGVNWALPALPALDVSLGVLARYAVPLPVTFTEELARYLMICMALLAVSSGIAHREHIGAESFFPRLPDGTRRALAGMFDAVAFVFFFALFW